MTLEYLEWDGQIIEPVAVAAIIEVDGANAALPEQEIAGVQIAMDQPKSIGFLPQRRQCRPDSGYDCRDHSSRLGRTDGSYGLHDALGHRRIEMVILPALHR